MDIIESVSNRVEIYEMKTKSEREIAESFFSKAYKKRHGACCYGNVIKFKFLVVNSLNR
jgi:hypothetical protein